MKTAIFLSCLIAGGSLFVKTHKTKTSLTLPAYKATTSKRSFSSMPIAPVSITIDKSSYELYVYDAKGWYATYPVVFGNSSLDDKKMEGDRNTPEGTFRIVNKRVHEKWDRYMGLDYPTQESIYKFNERKRRGEIPSSARPGAGIGIHGVWPHEDFVIDRYKNWTNGCISLKNSDVEELYRFIPVGTPVTIRK
ncbi:L,D-transpeptidase family protein [Flavisolibacter ginsengisoli]|jgi:lipoprotein-anchoring transpeptidase ErfK/SrfK|uniref:L,D-transpeptidase catalytic domain n=1 Tax=Flavisolibacter ginsengisoli DSM 18119 TaxID=1121884 RepID=A0A1M5G329_9BACT|nr:L,D-transpeptidase [Flavisolibacter ginsengisoli]SHF98119.1 L,D-transpeptidase catalytic domain [Flavisolibacter ginsengisoli DSM 18119]